MNIDWTKVYMPDPEGSPRPKKFIVLPATVPWSMDKDTNLWATVEWVYRAGRKEETRYDRNPTLNLIKDGWYRCEREEGKFLHACYPKDIISFRRQYESIYHSLGVPETFIEREKLTKIAREKLWAIWNCIGYDGIKRQPKEPSDDAPLEDILTYSNYHDWPEVWMNTCSRCCAPLPKGIQMWVKLQHSKLKDIA
jgi:hypothetical protein